MKITIRDKGFVLLRRLDQSDHDNLFHYLNSLGNDSRKRFGPHAFDQTAIQTFYSNPDHIGYVAEDENGRLVAYAVVKSGYLEHDRPRFQSYGLTPDHKIDGTFAPSVADDWQSCGLGQALLIYILDDIKKYGRKRLLLWGGVQADNKKALNFYTKNGFGKLGEFEYNGKNYDMIRLL